MNRLNDLYVAVTQEVVDFLGLDPEKDYNFVYSYVVAFIGILLTITMRKHG